jgi:hypothetical protein
MQYCRDWQELEPLEASGLKCWPCILFFLVFLFCLEVFPFSFVLLFLFVFLFVRIFSFPTFLALCFGSILDLSFSS